jgi:hypothetical protein
MFDTTETSVPVAHHDGGKVNDIGVIVLDGFEQKGAANCCYTLSPEHNFTAW